MFEIRTRILIHGISHLLSPSTPVLSHRWTPPPSRVRYLPRDAVPPQLLAVVVAATVASARLPVAVFLSIAPAFVIVPWCSAGSSLQNGVRLHQMPKQIHVQREPTQARHGNMEPDTIALFT